MFKRDPLTNETKKTVPNSAMICRKKQIIYDLWLRNYQYTFILHPDMKKISIHFWIVHFIHINHHFTKTVKMKYWILLLSFIQVQRIKSVSLDYDVNNNYYDGLLISISPDVPDPGKKGIGALELESQLRGERGVQHNSKKITDTLCFQAMA